MLLNIATRVCGPDIPVAELAGARDIPCSASAEAAWAARLPKKTPKNPLRNEWKSIRICRYYRLDLTN
jgi:hypothetical protein